MSKILVKTKSGIPTRELQLGLNEMTKCGAGVNVDKGYIALPNYNSLTGDKDGYYALYIVNGSIEIAPVATVEGIINGYCLNTAVTATSASITNCAAAPSIEVGDTFTLIAKVNPSGAIQTGVWTTSGAGVATVAGGIVTGVAPGTATITFTSTDGSFAATCLVTIIPAA